MTVQEVKESIEYLKMQLTEDLEMICFTGDELKALDMSIQALEEVEQYRALGTVEELKEAREKQPKTDWIPCEERLPSEENEDYLICTNEAHVRILLWTKRGWNTFIDSEGKYHTGAEIKNVIAWKPLPQPYKKEGAEDEN